VQRDLAAAGILAASSAIHAAVARMGGAQMNQVEESYAACGRAARRASSNFFYTFYLLPREQRRAMCAIYAYLRELDDLADHAAAAFSATNFPAAADPAAINFSAAGDLTCRVELTLLDERGELDERGKLNERSGALERRGITLVERGQARAERAGITSVRRARLDRYRADFAAAIGGAPRGAVLPAVIDTIRRFQIPPEYFTAVMDGVEMDVQGRQYENWQELEAYCYRVAAVVGLICLHVWGFKDAAAFVPARACGLAFQLTNILRDLGEDAARGRVYVPAEVLRECGYSRGELLRRKCSAGFYAVVEAEYRRAVEWYNQATELTCYLDRSSSRMYAAMHATYRALLDSIHRRADELLSRRVRVSRWQKLGIAARAAIFGGSMLKRETARSGRSSHGVAPRKLSTSGLDAP
jgi:phytoene synthase